MLTFNQLKKNLKKPTAGFKEIKVAILGDYATQFVRRAIEGYAIEKGYKLIVFEADYNQIDQQIENPNSTLYEFDPQYTFISQSSPKLLKKFQKCSSEEREIFAQNFIEKQKDYYQVLKERTKTKVVFDNFVEINDSVFGNFANKIANSFLFQLRKINFLMMEMVQELPDSYLLDLLSLQTELGNETVFDAKMYVNADMAYGLEFIPPLANGFTDILASIEGKFKKCLILDLDNTTWGGIIGDDGVEGIQVGDLGIGKAFTELQTWALELKNRGIILAICSKNTESVAKEPFEKHPEMVLRLSDISMFVANWENKADNIRHIKEVLNIGYDSMVFLDDNPFERNMVRTNVPEGITVPELPEDPAEYMSYIRTLNLFETASYSENDKKRTAQYQEQAKRAVARKKFTNEGDFLQSMEMSSKVEEFNNFNTPRVAQLSQRSNQFNLRTIRYTEDDVKQMAEDENVIDLTFTLDDKYGENGLICLLITKIKDQEAFIDTWIMSCRVLKRGMELFVLNTLAEIAKEKGITKLVGEYLPTPKNALVEDHYKNLGFVSENGLWVLDLHNFEPKKCFISKK
ncbi:MAG: HAD-IIIC family phosphatase [Flavobacteriales bacterium]|jgi:FkbH-like protein|nr:HAD-IIIC family phosphatase [Flavobacteriales bacterium]